MDPITLQLILGIIGAAAQILPELTSAIAPAEAALSGTATPADVAQLEAVRDSLNALVTAAENKVIDAPDPQSPAS